MTETRGSMIFALIGMAACAASPSDTRRVPGELGADGALQFASAEELFAAVEAIDRLTIAELDAWEHDLGFVSMRRAFGALELRLETASPAERAELLAAEAELLDRSSAAPRRRVPAHGYAALIDRRGVLYVGGVVHKVTETDVVSSLDGKLATIDRALAREPGLDGVRAFSYTDAGRATTADFLGQCGSVLGGQRSTSDRRVKYETRTFTFIVTTPIGYQQYRYRIEWEFWGFKKFLGSWIAYATTYQMYNVGIEMDVIEVTGYNGIRHDYTYRRLNDYFFTDYDSGNETSNGVTGVFAGHMVENVDPTMLRAPTFLKLHQETSSRGTSPARGVLDCNYCGDHTCMALVGETASTCTADCGYCGDNICFGSEDATWCSDCQAPSPCFIEPCFES